jgi:hypothetical protein
MHFQPDHTELAKMEGDAKAYDAALAKTASVLDNALGTAIKFMQ